MTLPTDLPKSVREAELMRQIIALQRQRSVLRAALIEAADLHDHRPFPLSDPAFGKERLFFWRRWEAERRAQAHLAEVQREKADEWYAILESTYD